jgi:hypothetical protein
MAMIIFGGWIVVITLLLALFLFNRSATRSRRRTGIPQRTVVGTMVLGLFGLVGLGCPILFMGGPDVRHELARRRQLATMTQSASALVEVHRCQLGLLVDTELVYRFMVPDPATGRQRTYRQQEYVDSGDEYGCSPIATPYQIAIWYDPANPQRATAQPLAAQDLYLPLALVILVGGCFGLLPLSGAIIALVAIAQRGGPDAQQATTDARLMEDAGFMIALDNRVITAARAATEHASMARYVREYHGRVYISLDFITDPVERDAAWNALWRIQSKGWYLGSDEERVSTVLRHLTFGETGGQDSRRW